MRTANPAAKTNPLLLGVTAPKSLIKGLNSVLKIISWILLPPLAVLVIAFAIANRHGVVVRLDPLPMEIDLPLYAVAFGGVLIGLLFGGVASWLRGGRWRREARRQRRRVRRLENEVETTAAQKPAAAKAGGNGDVPKIESAA